MTPPGDDATNPEAANPDGTFRIVGLQRAGDLVPPEPRARPVDPTEVDATATTPAPTGSWPADDWAWEQDGVFGAHVDEDPTEPAPLVGATPAGPPTRRSPYGSPRRRRSRPTQRVAVVGGVLALAAVVVVGAVVALPSSDPGTGDGSRSKSAGSTVVTAPTSTLPTTTTTLVLTTTTVAPSVPQGTVVTNPTPAPTSPPPAGPLCGLLPIC